MGPRFRSAAQAKLTATGLTTLLDHFESLLPVLEQAFRVLERRLPAPVLTLIGGRKYPRYKEKTADQAALQKVARYISGLYALVLLLKNRHLQEDGTLKRTLDELGEDIMFLLMQPATENEHKLRQRYLDGFYDEEFDPGVSPMDSKRKRKRVQRREIRDYIHARTAALDPRGKRANEVVYQGYSGYVHADSPHLMEMWDWDTRLYELKGARDINLLESHLADATNYFVRGFYSVAALASWLGETALFVSLRDQGDHLSDLAAKL